MPIPVIDLSNPLVAFVLFPLLIILSRIFDVSMGTIRIIYLSRGLKYVAAVIGFFEVFVWILAMGQIIENLTNIFYYIAYAFGFAMGNYVGVSIEQKIASGMLAVHVITKKTAENLTQALREKNYGITTVYGEGAEGEVQMLYSVIKRKTFSDFVATVKEYNPAAFIATESIQAVSGGVFPVYHRKIFPSLSKRK